MKVYKYKNNALFRHIRTTGHEIAWDKVEFIAFETRTQCRKMKETFYIDMYAAKNGVMKPRDGTQKDTCWNMIIPILNKICIVTFPYQQAFGTTR